MPFTGKFVPVYLALKTEEETSNKWKIGPKQVIETCTGIEWREQLWPWKCKYCGVRANL